MLQVAWGMWTLQDLVVGNKCRPLVLSHFFFFL